MYFKRKIDPSLDRWLANYKYPALIVGIRQCGKTESIIEFAKRNKLNMLYINFWTNPEISEDFDSKLDVDTIISNLSLRFPNNKITEDTLICFDEIQDCPRARLAFKNFAQDKRYKVIDSGSYLGINGYNIGDTTPVPTGYEEVFELNTMDFEEFLWALGYRENQINILIEHFNNKTRIPNNIHELYKDLYLKYAMIGGFPKVVKTYVDSHMISKAYEVLNSTIFDMQSDFGRRKDKNGNAIFNAREVAKIKSVFDLIPTFLAKESKRFIVSKVSGGTQYDKNNAIEYLRQAHIVSKVFNLEVPSLPLKGSNIKSQFKLFPTDIGIVTSMYGIDTVAQMNKGELGQGSGALYEALVFDGLNKCGIEPYYFAKESGLEIDFVIAYKGDSTLIEAKTKTGNTKSSKTVMNHPDHYGKTKLIKIGDYNISEEGDIVTIPHYLIFALGKEKYDF